MTENKNNDSNGNNRQYDLLLERFHSNVQKNPNKVAIAYLKSVSNQLNNIKIERQLSYQELDTITTVLANRLRFQYNIQHGDRVVLVYPPSLDFMISFIGCCKANIIAVPVFPPNPNRKDNISMFCKIVKECDAKYALTNKEYNYAKKLSTIQEAISKFKASKQQQSTTSWPDSLQWIVTDTIMDINSNEKKTKGKQPNNESQELVRDQQTDQIAFLQFTSGSTSDPKGVMITHGNLGHNLTIITNELQADGSTVVVSWLPQYHDMGLIGSYLGILYCGGTGYYMSPLTFLQRPAIWIEAISLYKATHLQAPNFAFKLTVRKFNPDDYTHSTGIGTGTSASNGKLAINLSSVRHVINAAEPVDEESLRLFYGTFSNYGFQTGVIFPTYGLAEHTVFVCSGGKQIISVNKHELEVNGIVKLIEVGNDPSVAVSRLVGCGYPEHQNVILKIVKTDHGDDADENDESSAKYYATGEDIVGEIWIHSPSKAVGYYNKPVESKHDFYASLSSSDLSSPNEYLRTGDLGFIHNKELFICGRLKDLIIIGGRNYYPQDIESTAESALSETQIRYGCSAAFTINPTPNAAVISENTANKTAEASSGGGEEVAVIMELRDVPSKTSESTTKVWENLADQVKAAITQEHSLSISVFIFVKPRTVPKTSSGKIARSWCRKSYVNNTLQIVYKKSFSTATATTLAPLEIEGPETTAPVDNEGASRPIPKNKNSKLSATELRALSKEEIIQRLVSDVAEVASIPAETIDTKVALATLMDSIAISQFKGYFEINYHVNELSDEYLLRDTSSITKLCEIAKLGYAPDDNARDGTNEGVVLQQEGGKATGLAGALGCPPGVVCVIL